MITNSSQKKFKNLIANQTKYGQKKNDIEMHSTDNEGKCVIAETFIRTLQNKIYKHMTPISKKYVY